MTTTPSITSVVTAASSGALTLWEHYPLPRLVFGPGAVERLGELARELGGQRILLVTDPGLRRAGHADHAAEILRRAGLEVFVFDAVEENPTTRHVEAGAAFARPLHINLIVAVGGGSAMDCAKGINFLLTNGGRMSDYRGFGKARLPMLPAIGVPTTAGTGSEAQSYALIADEHTHLKMACGDRQAAFRIALLDPDLTLSQPPRVTALTGLDALTHAVESYVTTRRNPLSQLFAREAWRLLSANLRCVLQAPHDRPARAAMQLGAFLAGAAIENSMLGAAHACANPLTAHYGLTHGLAVGLLLPHVIRFNAPVVGELYAELLALSEPGNGDRLAAAEHLAQFLTHFLRLAGLPTRLADCGVAYDILPVLAEEANQQWTARFNPRPVSEAELLALYQAAW
jgi:alcohol dehydrogenase